jgi:outer membrane protein TolC
VGPQEQHIGLSQTFPSFGERGLRADAASAGARAVGHAYEAARLRLHYEVKQTYYELYYLDRSTEIAVENLALLQRFELTARARHRAGGTLAGVLKTQVELGKQEDHLRSLLDRREPLLASLNAVVGLPAAQPLIWPESMAWNGASSSGEALLVSLTETSPHLSRLDAEAEEARLLAALSRRETWPELSIGINYIETGDALDPSSPGSGDDPILATVSLNLPIWFGRDRQRVRSAASQQDRVAAEREDGERRLRADLKMALYRHRDAARKLSLFADTLIPQAAQALSVTEEAYRAGAMGFADLIDAQRLLLELQLGVERARVDREIALADVEMLAGVEEVTK